MGKLKNDLGWQKSSSCLKYLYGGMMVAVLLLLCFKDFFPRAARYYLMPEIGCSYVWLLLCGVTLLVLLHAICRLLFRKVQNGKYAALWLGLVFLLLQWLLVYNYYFETEWDVQQLVGAAQASACGDWMALQSFSWYFSECPNNLFLTSLFAQIFKVGGWIGLQGIFPLLALQCLLGIVVSWMLFQTIFRCYGFATAFFGQLLYLLFVGLSPWFSIPYSDTFSLFFCMGMVWLALTSVLEKKPGLQWFLLSFFAGVGYAVKPQILFVFLALLLVRFPRAGRKGLPLLKKWFRSASLPLIIIGFIASMLITTVAGNAMGILRNTDRAFGMTHYLLMGMNSRTMGDYAPEDVVFSREYPTRLARAEAELRETGRRISDMAVFGFCRHICEKTILTYGDGTFSWGKEGLFFKTIYPEKNNPISSVTRKIYYTKDYGGVYFPIYCHFALILWLGIIFFGMVGSFLSSDPMVKTVCIALLLLALFEMLFECRARYLFGFTPLYILCACAGLKEEVKRFKRL
ncbi:MAG: hypothetical protein J5792_03725 [Bacteroidales bacterium]|nr:hypothetical protein [Bacteroidales bacterium]